ncbi:PAS domain-containing protein, partial [uncultured Cetobacterium sp.]|uniref:PAS domain-containing protein n=1 Tax=uncultured Cetobacterium sp. TaxID=527638 RepID=UPI00260A0650
MNKKKHEEIILNCRIFLRGKKLSFELIDTPKEMEKMNYLSEILERSQDLMFFKDKKLKYKYVNSSFANLFECDRDLIYNKSDRDILPEELYNQSERGDLLALENGYYLEIE